MKKKIVRSPFFYVGDKYKLIEEISSYFPDDIEKFVCWRRVGIYEY